MGKPLSTQGVGTVIQDPNTLNTLAINADGSINTNGGGGGGGGTGTNGSTAPTTSVSNGYTNAAGNQTAVSPTTPLPSLSEGTYNSTAPTLTNGQVSSVQLDANGNLYTYDVTLKPGQDQTYGVQAIAKKTVIGTNYSQLPYASSGAATATVKGSLGQIFSAFAFNVGATLAYLQIFNAATATGTPIMYLPLPAGSATNPGFAQIDASIVGPNGLYCATAITIGLSSTPLTYTAVATPANFGFTGTYA